MGYLFNTDKFHPPSPVYSVILYICPSIYLSFFSFDHCYAHSGWPLASFMAPLMASLAGDGLHTSIAGIE